MDNKFPGNATCLSILYLAEILLIFLLAACTWQGTAMPTREIALSETPVPSAMLPFSVEQTATLALTPKPAATRRFTNFVNTPTATRLHSEKPIFHPTKDATQRAWYATAVSIEQTQVVEEILTQEAQATQFAGFPTACDEMNDNSSSVSPNGEWFAASCGYKRDQTLIVQNDSGTKWVLKFVDFLSPEFSEGVMGAIYPISWGIEGEYLYFGIMLGYSGGGTLCFPGFGDYGLFRLNLKTGAWKTLYPFEDSFPGYEIKFSPNGRHYAVNVYKGVRISDLKTGKVTEISNPGVIDMSWSPDGRYLAYSVGSCGEPDGVLSSSIYAWDARTGITQLLYITPEERMLLRPAGWNDASTLRFEGEVLVERNFQYTVFVFDIAQGSLTFTGTPTPDP